MRRLLVSRETLAVGGDSVIVTLTVTEDLEPPMAFLTCWDTVWALRDACDVIPNARA